MAPAVVVGLDCITGLQTARILAGNGIPVIGVARDPRHFSCRTRACERVVPGPTPQETLLDVLVRLGESLDGRGVLFPCTDESVRQISAAREQLAEAFVVLLPAHDVVMRLMDKLGFESLAGELGIPTPVTVTLRSRSDAESSAREVTFPVVVKPALKSREWLEHAPAKVLRAADPAELLRIYDAHARWADGLLLQEWVVGGDENLYSCNAYFDEHARPLATFVARKLRQWPPEAGTSSFGEEVRNDEVLDMTKRLFEGVGFHGLAYLEVKRDSRTGRHLAIEPNVGRPTGRSAIAEAGGVNLLLAAYRDAVGGPLPAGLTQRYGNAKWIYLRHDFQSAVHAWRRGQLTPGGWLRSIRGVRRDAVWSWRDPMPFVYDVVQTTAKVVGKRRSLRRARRGVTRTPEAPLADAGQPR